MTSKEGQSCPHDTEEADGSRTSIDARPFASTSSLNLRGAKIQTSADGGTEPQEVDANGEAPDIVLPHQEVEHVRHIALDIGGSLIKLVYFSPTSPSSSPGRTPESSTSQPDSPNITFAPPAAGASDGDGRADAADEDVGDRASRPALRSMHSGADLPEDLGRGGKLHFVKFETARIADAIAFIKHKRLLTPRGRQCARQVHATGGGAFKYADLFKEELGVILKKEDEMDCLVGGCNFLLRALRHEAFEFDSGSPTFVSHTDGLSQLYPYLLVNIGSGVSMVKVDGSDDFERVSGTNLGGGTFWGLCRLLTRVRSFDEMLELSRRGNSANVDMLVGDIYGGRDYEHMGLSASMIASSFGKVVSQDANLEDYDPADLALALCRMVSYNIGHLAFLNAKRYNISRVFFGGFFIRGHPYTMDVISYAIRFWSKGEISAMFLRHEGFLGAMGAFLKAHPRPHSEALRVCAVGCHGCSPTPSLSNFSATDRCTSVQNIPESSEAGTR